MIVSSTVIEAFQGGAHIAKPEDLDDQYITLSDHRVWRLTNWEWRQSLLAVRAVSRFLASVCGPIIRHPLPTEESLDHFLPTGHGSSFRFNAEGDQGYALDWDTLAYCIRYSADYYLDDCGLSIDQSSLMSDLALWCDVIRPAIERGEIIVTVWGEPL
jgi:hypothetical protein